MGWTKLSNLRFTAGLMSGAVPAKILSASSIGDNFIIFPLAVSSDIVCRDFQIDNTLLSTRRVVMHPFAYAPGGRVRSTNKCWCVPGVINELQIGEDVLDLRCRVR